MALNEGIGENVPVNIDAAEAVLARAETQVENGEEVDRDEVKGMIGVLQDLQNQGVEDQGVTNALVRLIAVRDRDAQE